MRKYAKLLGVIIIIIITFTIFGNIYISEAKKTIGKYVVFVGDRNGNEKVSFEPGDVVYLWLEGTYNETLYVSVAIRDPNGNPVAEISNIVEVSGTGKHLLIKWHIPVSAPMGKYIMSIFLGSDENIYEDSIYFEVGLPATSPNLVTRDESGISNTLLLGVITVVALAILGAVAYIFFRSSRTAKQVEVVETPGLASQSGLYSGIMTGEDKSPASVMQPSILPPPPAPSLPQSGETSVITPQSPAFTPSSNVGGGQTIVVLARFVTPDGKTIPITKMHQKFGREDFVGVVPNNLLSMISRRSKPHFEVFLNTQAKQWFIVDNNSANGTFVNGENIRGKGPVPLKSGDIVSPAGVIDLKFEEH